MAEGKSDDCDIVPARDTHLFHFRVRFSPHKDSPSGQTRVHAATVVAGRRCDVSCWPWGDTDQIVLSLLVGYGSNPALEGAAEVTADMVLLDKTGSPAPSTGRGTTVLAAKSRRSGYFLQARRGDVEANCVVNDYFVVLCSVSVDIVRDGTPPSPSMEKQLPDLAHDLARMSDEQDLTDVSFNVEGETFSAHRLVLAAQSPVFRAELYGPMAERKMTSITIQDMRASSFRIMLHFMYHGSWPSAEKTDDSSTVAEYQHLVVAANRYGLERLKKICEDKLCGGGIAVDTVVSMLELAEEHACSELKARCLDFLADGENFKMVATTEEYIHLIQSFPSLLAELQNIFRIAHEKLITMKSTARKKK